MVKLLFNTFARVNSTNRHSKRESYKVVLTKQKLHFHHKSLGPAMLQMSIVLHDLLRALFKWTHHLYAYCILPTYKKYISLLIALVTCTRCTRLIISNICTPADTHVQYIHIGTHIHTPRLMAHMGHSMSSCPTHDFDLFHT